MDHFANKKYVSKRIPLFFNLKRQVKNFMVVSIIIRILVYIYISITVSHSHLKLGLILVKS